MRKRARQREGYDEDEGGSSEVAVEQTASGEHKSEPSSKHINFFQDVGKGVSLCKPGS